MSFVASLSLDAPIVLAHGLFGFGRIGFGPLTFAQYFRDIPRFLQSLGNRVLVTQVPPLAGIARRAEALGERIDQAYPDEPVHIIGHSMGGLDARALISHEDWSHRVLSLTTIATPHLGSPLADLARLQVGRVYRWLDKLRVEHDGLLDVTRRSARAFHRRSHLPDRVACFSVAGSPVHEEVSRPLRRLHGVLEQLEGPNDGLVSVASATAFGTPLRSWPLDHLQQVNWLMGGARRELDSTIETCYTDILENLMIAGFSISEHVVSGQHSDTGCHTQHM